MTVKTTNDQIERLKRIRDQNFYFKSSQGDNYLKYKYGLTKLDVVQMLIDQKGYCDCCGKDLERNKWAIDHNAVTMRNRGLLCYGCNTGIGKLGGKIEGILKAVAYLQKHGES
jgi:hypothetical protein